MKIKSLLVIAALAFMMKDISAQGLKQVVFSTAGTFLAPGNKVRVYSMNPANNTAAEFDTIYGDFSNDVVVDSVFAYVHIGRVDGSPAGEDMIVKYNLLTHQRVDSITNIPGTQKLIITPQHLVVMRGYGATSDYVKFYDKSTLNLVYSDNTLQDMAAAGTYMNDSVYVGFNRNDSGAVAVYSANNPARQRIVMFDTLSAGINSMSNDGSSIFLLGERYNMSTFNLMYGSITKFNPMSTFQSVTTPVSTGLIRIVQDSIIGDFGNTNAYNKNTLTPLTFDLQSTYSKGIFVSGSDLFYVQETDYFSFGNVSVYNLVGSLIASVATDISGSAIAADYSGSPLTVTKTNASSVSTFPNPATDHLNIISKGTNQFRIFSATGQLVNEGQINGIQRLDISTMEAGIYFLILSGNTQETIRFVKQ